MANHLNVEIKAKINNIETLRNYLLENATENKGTDIQTDTYFNVPEGRLKLREGNIENSLIFYNRVEKKDGPKESFVELVKQTPNSGMKQLLEKSNGIMKIVKKRREIFFIDNVKFHIDEVEGLGQYIEIEAIDYNNDIGLKKLHEQCLSFMKLFKISNDSIIDKSYSDMIH